MGSREVRKIQRELLPVLKSLDIAIRKIFDRWTKGERSLTNAGEIDPILTDYHRIMHDHNVMTARTQKLLDTIPVTEAQAKEYKENLGMSIEAMHDLHHRLDKSEEDFLKYDVPRLRRFESLEACVKALRAFMRVWREEAEKGREKEEKCLIDWLQQLGQSDDVKKRNTFEEIRLVAVHLGVRISYPLASYCMLMAVMAESWDELRGKIQEVYTVIQCLEVDENSAIIDRFLASVVYIYKALDESWSEVIVKKKKKEEEEEEEEEEENAVAPRESPASDLLHLILREVLRFEVAFCCPDLPMLVTNEVFLGMGKHLKEVFEKKLNNVNVKANEVGKELQQSVRDEDLEKYTFMKRLLEEGLRMLWDKLELKPIDGERPSFNDF